MKFFDEHLPFYRANFHLHTTCSDGRKTPEEAMADYRAQGYDILAITDHRKVTLRDGSVYGLLMIPGIELDFLLPGQAVHLLGLGVREEIASLWNRQGTPQEAVDAIHHCGGLAVLAHPAWSMNTTETMASLQGIAAVEIWNSVSTLPVNAIRADSSSMLDALWANHPQTLCPVMANDDTHQYGSEFAKGWNMIQAESLSVDAVLDAVRAGRFYATQGPTIDQLEMSNQQLTVSCSSAEAIIFYSNTPWVAGRSVIGHDLRTATYQIRPSDRYVRVQVLDVSGQSAWSRPIPVAL